MQEKDELLLELDAYEEGERNLDSNALLWALMLLLASVLAFAPKIYLRSNIYYTSREVLYLQTQADSLQEENRYLRKQLEEIKFKLLLSEM